MNRFFRITGIIFVLLLGSSLLTFFTYSDLGDEEYYAKFQNDYGIYSLKIPGQFTLFGEAVPMQDPQIKERFDREMLVNTYWQSNTLLFLKRSAKYFPVIEPILRKNGIPNDFKYLPLIESGLMNVISPAGAVGRWQIMEGTGRELGLEIDREVDERYHLVKSTRAACQYLKEAYEKLGSWTLAAAAYNAGMDGIKRQLERQNTDNYYGLNLNTETARYLFRIMAVKKILSNPREHGFHLRQQDTYERPKTFTVTVDSTVTHFKYLIDKYGINYRILKYHNPWLRMEHLPNPSGKKYKIKIPKKGQFQLAHSVQTSPGEKSKLLEEQKQKKTRESEGSSLQEKSMDQSPE